MTTIEVMRKALEALVWEVGSEPALYAPRTRDAIAALRAELERMEDVLEPSKSRKHGLAPHMTREAQQASSWRMVCATLDEVLPDWLEIETGLDITQSKAVCAIHHLAKRRIPTPTAAIPALTDFEIAQQYRVHTKSLADDMHWAYALAAERAGVEIEE